MSDQAEQAAILEKARFLERNPNVFVQVVADEGEKVHGPCLLVRQQAGEGYEVTGPMAADCAVIRVDVSHPRG